MNDDEFRTLLDDRKMSWKGYRRIRKGVKKRLRRHMRELGCRHNNHYIERLKTDPAAEKKFKILMTVSISRFFRDRQLWEDLADRYIPELAGKFPEGIRVWSAGCAGGEEAYSFRILWHRLAKMHGRLPPLEILATDNNSECIHRAQAGLFRASSLREIRDDDRLTFFRKRRQGRLFEIRPDLVSAIVFEQRDLLHKPPNGVFQFIFLRNNLLTYHRFQSIRSSFERIVNCLTPGGILIIGAHEKLPTGAEHLKPCGAMVWKRMTHE